MPVLDILCLANSYKRRGRCIAGLRIDGGGWVRACADTANGELYPDHYRLQNGGTPGILDILRIPFAGPRPEPHHPENWLIAREPWQLIERGAAPAVTGILGDALAAGPELLGDASRRILAADLARSGTVASLALIRPNSLAWAIVQTPENARKPRAMFVLDGAKYRLPATDPACLEALRALPLGEHPVSACGIDASAELLLTVSLSEPFDDGYCYKLAAGIVAVRPGIIGAVRPDPVMDRAEAAWILDALARGMDPYSGEPLGKNGPLANPDTVRALRTAVVALNVAKPAGPRRALPEKAGKAWDTDEEAALVRAFDGGEKLAAIARVQGRTQEAIRKRLIRLGKLHG